MGGPHHRARQGGDRRLRPALRTDEAQLHPRRLWFLALAQWRGADVRGDLPALGDRGLAVRGRRCALLEPPDVPAEPGVAGGARRRAPPATDRKSTRLNSSHQIISYAVFCLKKKSRGRRANRSSTGVGGGRRPFPGGAVFFFFNDTATTEIYTLSLHDALPTSPPA